MAPSPDSRGPAKAGRSDRGARSLRDLAEAAERDRSSPAEEAQLLRRAAGGDAQAGQRLFHENLNLVLRSAHSEAAAEAEGLSEDELVQEGSLGLMDAIKSYPESGRDDFRAYAQERIDAHIGAAQAEQRETARGKAQLIEDAEAYERAEVSIRREKGREPTDRELAEKLEWSAAKTRRLGELVNEARRRHDEELLEFIDPEDLPDDLIGLDE